MFLSRSVCIAKNKLSLFGIRSIVQFQFNHLQFLEYLKIAAISVVNELLQSTPSQMTSNRFSFNFFAQQKDGQLTERQRKNDGILLWHVKLVCCVSMAHSMFACCAYQVELNSFIFEIQSHRTAFGIILLMWMVLLSLEPLNTPATIRYSLKAFLPIQNRKVDRNLMWFVIPTKYIMMRYCSRAEPGRKNLHRKKVLIENTERELYKSNSFIIIMQPSVDLTHRRWAALRREYHILFPFFALILMFQ